MGKLLFLYISIFLFSLFFGDNTSFEKIPRNDRNNIFLSEQLSSSEPTNSLHNAAGYHHGNAHVSLNSAKSRRGGYTKPVTTKWQSRADMLYSMLPPPRKHKLNENYFFTNLLASRYSNGFYIYSLKRLIV